MKKFALAAVATFALVGFVMAEEFTLQITGISGDGALTGTKVAKGGGLPGIGGKGGAGGKGGKGGAGGFGGFGKGEEVTVKVASGVKVFKGKFDAEAKAVVADGDDLKLAGLKSAVEQAQNGNVLVEGKGLASSDTLELTVKNGKPGAKLNGKDVDFGKVQVKGKAALNTTVTTGDDGTVTQVLITGGGGAFGAGKGGAGGFGKGKGKGGN